HVLPGGESFLGEVTRHSVERVKDRSDWASGTQDENWADGLVDTAPDVQQRVFAPSRAVVPEEERRSQRLGPVQRHHGAAGASLRHPDSTVAPELLASVAAAPTEIRRTKTEAKVSQKTAVATVTIQAPTSVVSAIRSAEGDLKAAGRIETLLAEEVGEEITIGNISFVEQA